MPIKKIQHALINSQIILELIPFLTEKKKQVYRRSNFKPHTLQLAEYMLSMSTYNLAAAA